jgi:hypothetical protein
MYGERIAEGLRRVVPPDEPEDTVGHGETVAAQWIDLTDEKPLPARTRPPATERQILAWRQLWGRLVSVC